MDMSTGLAYFFSSLVPIPLIERLGRRKLMLFGAVGQCICMILLAAMTQDQGNTAKGIVATVCLLYVHLPTLPRSQVKFHNDTNVHVSSMFNFFFAVGWLAIPCASLHNYLRLTIMRADYQRQLYRALPRRDCPIADSFEGSGLGYSEPLFCLSLSGAD